MVKHSIQQGGVVVVLAVQVLTDNLDMCLLAHLLRGLHSKTDMAYFLSHIRLAELLLHHGAGWPDALLGAATTKTTVAAPSRGA